MQVEADENRNIRSHEFPDPATSHVINSYADTSTDDNVEEDRSARIERIRKSIVQPTAGTWWTCAHYGSVGKILALEYPVPVFVNQRESA